MALTAAALLPGGPARAQAPARVAVIQVVSSINPGSADFIMGSIERAHAKGYGALVIELDTPGGLVSSTRDIVKAILNAPLPVIVYVGPDGAHAGSAGVFITLAAHVAAMAPSTNIGAAHPVGIGGGGGDKDKDKDKGPRGDDAIMAQKIENDTAAFIKAIAERRKRNVEWAVKAVRDSVSITASEALKDKVIDLVAGDRAGLLAAIDGREVQLGAHQTVKLHTAGAVVELLEMSPKQRLVNAFSDPNVAAILGTLGMLGILVEFYHPGTFVPGILGGIFLILALISFQAVPINGGAVLLILLGLALIAAELFVSSSGLLGAAGGVSALLGGFLLVDTESPEFVPGSTAIDISPWVLWPSGLLLIGSALALGLLVGRAQRRVPVTGREAMIGLVAEVRTAVAAEPGQVFVHGELWNAVTAGGQRLEPGSKARVLAQDGMLLTVEPVATPVPVDGAAR